MTGINEMLSEMQTGVRITASSPKTLHQYNFWFTSRKKGKKANSSFEFPKFFLCIPCVITLNFALFALQLCSKLYPEVVLLTISFCMPHEKIMLFIFPMVKKN